MLSYFNGPSLGYLIHSFITVCGISGCTYHDVLTTQILPFHHVKDNSPTFMLSEMVPLYLSLSSSLFKYLIYMICSDK